MASTVAASASLAGGGAVVKTSGGTVYAIACTIGGGTVFVAKYSGGSWTTVSQTANGTVFTSGITATYCHAAIDSANTIHVIAGASSNSGTRDISYATYNTSTDSFSAWESVATVAAFQSLNGFIVIDSGNKPHVAYATRVSNMGNDYDRVYYTNKVSGSWLTPEMVSTGTTTNYWLGSMTIRSSDIIEVLYRTSASGLYRTRTSGSWGSETTLSSTYPESLYQGLTATTGGTVYRYTSDDNTPALMAENGTSTTHSSYVTLSVPGSNGIPAVAALVSSTRYLFYINNSDRDLYITSNSGGGWSSATVLQTGTFLRVTTSWSYNYHNFSSEIGYLFDDGTNLYYDVYTLSSTDIPYSIMPSYRARMATHLAR